MQASNHILSSQQKCFDSTTYLLINLINKNIELYDIIKRFYIDDVSKLIYFLTIYRNISVMREET